MKNTDEITLTSVYHTLEIMLNHVDSINENNINNLADIEQLLVELINEIKEKLGR